jgi:transcriptional regulator with XRE-family HTH domain
MLYTISLPVPLQRLLRKLGADLRDARRRRGIPTTLMAERCSISRTTLHKIERGDPTVAFGNYAMALFVLGMTDRLSEIADAKHDTLGQQLENEKLPKRIRKANLANQPIRNQARKPQ